MSNQEQIPTHNGLDQNASGKLERTSSETILVGLSACLAGQEVRYNGGHSRSQLCLEILSRHFTFMTFCPEVAAGFGTPRPTMRLTGNPESPKLRLSDGDQSDLTDKLIAGFAPKLDGFADLDGYILMKNSPSCGSARVKVFQDNGNLNERRGQGLFAAALKTRYPQLPVEEEGRLNDAQLKENFVLRIYAHHNFRREVAAAPSLHKLIQFHSSYKYVLMAHHQESYRELGRKLATADRTLTEQFVTEYLKVFMTALSKPADRKNHTNTLLHILGYLKKDVPAPARHHIAKVIGKYHQGQVPLITPLTLLSHYLQQHGSEYIRTQRYLQPYPESLGLSNQI